MKRIPITLIMLVTSLLTMTTAVAEDNNLADILAAQSDENRARYQYRNPEETLNFFGIEPGMTVVEALVHRHIAPVPGCERQSNRR